MSVEDVVKKVSSLEERFLESGDKTGDPDIDQDTGEVGTVEDRFEEVESLMQMAQSSALTAYQAVEQLLKRGHQDKLDTLFGEGAKDLLEQTKRCLESISEMFALEPGAGSEEDSEEEEEEDTESEEDESDEGENEEEESEDESEEK